MFSTNNYNSTYIHTIPNNNNHHWSDHHHNCHHHHSNMQLRPGQQSHKDCRRSGNCGQRISVAGGKQVVGFKTLSFTGFPKKDPC